MAHAPVILAQGNEQATEFGGCGLGESAHVRDELAGFRAGLVAEALVGDGHEFFGVHVVYHADRGVLWGSITVIVTLAVVALRFYIWLRVNVAAQMNTNPRGTLYVEAVA